MAEIIEGVSNAVLILVTAVPGGLWYSAAKTSFEAGDFQQAAAAGVLFLGWGLIFLGAVIIVFVGWPLTKIRKEIKALRDDNEP